MLCCSMVSAWLLRKELVSLAASPDHVTDEIVNVLGDDDNFLRIQRPV